MYSVNQGGFPHHANFVSVVDHFTKKYAKTYMVLVWHMILARTQ